MDWFISSIISPSLSAFLFDSEKILNMLNQQKHPFNQGIQTLIGADLIVNLEDDLGLLKKYIKDANPRKTLRWMKQSL